MDFIKGTHLLWHIRYGMLGDIGIFFRLLKLPFHEVSGLSVLSTDRSPYEIQLWSGMRMLRSFRTDQPTFQIPMAGLPAGLYFVRVVKDGQTHTQKLIKK